MRISEIFETMALGPAPESAAEAQAWLQCHSAGFGHFINGRFTPAQPAFDSTNPATGATLARLSHAGQPEIDAAVAAAGRAQRRWAALGGHGRARYLYALARMVQKHARLFAVLEALDNGKPLRETRDIDIPLVHRHFYHHAGHAQLLEAHFPGQGPLGVCAQIIPWNFPLLMLAWKLAPALAAGNCVVLKPAEQTPLTALLFAQICHEAGLPRGVVNIITGDGETGAALAAHPGVQKVAFTGSTDVGRAIRRATAGQGKALTLELGGKSAYIVCEDADIDSAVEGLVDAIWMNQGQVCCAGARLLVQEGIAETFLARLRARMAKLRLGDPLDKCIDIGAIVSAQQAQRIAQMLATAPEGSVYQPAQPSLPEGGHFVPPTLVCNLPQAHPLMQEEIFGPVLVACSFRTHAEAIELANNTRYGLAATIWSENINLALGLAPKLVAGVVWINCTNMFDAAAPFGGLRDSGFGREGGPEGMAAYLAPLAKGRPAKPVPAFGPRQGAALASAGLPAIDQTQKLYIGGKQARPDSGYSQPVYGAKGQLLGHAPQANRKDLRNAVQAAQAARGWASSSGHARAQVLYYLAENLQSRADAMAHAVNEMTGRRDGMAEVDTSLERLFTYAAWADKYDGRVANVPLRGLALALRGPVGVIGALCPDDLPLLGLISVLGPALAMGNRAVVVASQPFPLVAGPVYQLLETSDIPAGVANILTGQHAELAPHMARHAGIDAIWGFSNTNLSADIEAASADTLKRTWVNNGHNPDWFGPAGAGRAFLDAATEVKTVWVPYGE